MSEDVKPVIAEPMTQEQIDEAAVMGSLALLQAGQAFYNEPANPDELDLVKAVRDNLFENGMTEEMLAKVYDNSVFIKEATGRHTHAQQFNLTRWVDDQLSRIQVEDGIDTRLVRYQAIYEIKPEQWLKVFDEGIRQTLLEHGIRN